MVPMDDSWAVGRRAAGRRRGEGSGTASLLTWGCGRQWWTKVAGWKGTLRLRQSPFRRNCLLSLSRRARRSQALVVSPAWAAEPRHAPGVSMMVFLAMGVLM